MGHATNIGVMEQEQGKIEVEDAFDIRGEMLETHNVKTITEVV